MLQVKSMGPAVILLRSNPGFTNCDFGQVTSLTCLSISVFMCEREWYWSLPHRIMMSIKAYIVSVTYHCIINHLQTGWVKTVSTIFCWWLWNLGIGTASLCSMWYSDNDSVGTRGSKVAQKCSNEGWGLAGSLFSPSIVSHPPGPFSFPGTLLSFRVVQLFYLMASFKKHESRRCKTSKISFLLPLWQITINLVT